MAPLDRAGLFATIVGLLADFKQEEQSRRDEKRHDFFEWLEYHRHEELKNVICNNAALSAEVNRLLQTQNDTILRELRALNLAFVSVASQFAGFKGLVTAAVRPEDQNAEALDLLRKLVACKWWKFITLPKSGGGLDFLIIEGEPEGSFDHDSTFIKDDLETLVEWGLLRKDHDSRGEEVFMITRNAVKLITAASSTSTESIITP